MSDHDDLIAQFVGVAAVRPQEVGRTVAYYILPSW